jgi:hypothetical protein
MTGAVAAAARERWHRHLRHLRHNQHHGLLLGLADALCSAIGFVSLLQCPRRTTERLCASCCAAAVLHGHTSDTEIASISWVTTPRSHHQCQARIDCSVNLCRTLVLAGLTNGSRVPPSWSESSVSRPDIATVSELSLTINERCHRFCSRILQPHQSGRTRKIKSEWANSIAASRFINPRHSKRYRVSTHPTRGT